MSLLRRAFLCCNVNRTGLISVKRHSVGFHPYLLLYLFYYLFVFFASFLCLAGYEVKMGGCVCENGVNKAYDELHVFLDKAS